MTLLHQPELCSTNKPQSSGPWQLWVTVNLQEPCWNNQTLRTLLHQQPFCRTSLWQCCSTASKKKPSYASNLWEPSFILRTLSQYQPLRALLPLDPGRVLACQKPPLFENPAWAPTSENTMLFLIFLVFFSGSNLDRAAIYSRMYFECILTLFCGSACASPDILLLYPCF